MGYKSPFSWPLHPTPFIIFLISTTTSSFSTPPPSLTLPPPRPTPPNSTLKPSMTIIIGILTTIFSITFLLLLYARHCRRSNNGYPSGGMVMAGRFTDRINSGIDRTIIESLPVFRFESLTGHKDGLECVVCLSRFDPSEVLRLLPKCKHAFHVECVDTWLDAHSTCPLCRYRVDPEDIFLILNKEDLSRDIEISSPEVKLEVALHRVSGRHSSAGEKVTGVQIPVTGSRRSFDSSNFKKKVVKKMKKNDETMSLKAVSAVKLGCVDRYRKDGLLLAADVVEEERRRQRRRRSFEKRFEHRIVVGTNGAHRWSDVQPSDLLYLRSEMILSDVRRLKRSRPSVLHEGGNNGWWQNGRGVINSRSVSEMTGLSRFGSNEEAGVLSRWLARLSEPKSGRNSSSSTLNV